jgi:hypothetical protein
LTTGLSPSMVQDSAASSSRLLLTILKCISFQKLKRVCSPTTPIQIGLGCSPVARRY